MKCTQDNVTLLFFPDFSPATTIRRKAFNPVLKKMTALGLQPFLTYPAAIKLWHKCEQRSFDSPQKAEDFISSLSQKKHMLKLYRATGIWRPSSLRPGGRGLKAGMEAIPTARETMVAGWRWISIKMEIAKSLFIFLFFYFLSPPGILSLSIRYNNLFAGKTNTLFSFLEGTNGE